MVRVWQLPTDNHTVDALTEDFDYLVLTVASIHDNLALLGGKYFELKGLRRTDFGLLNRRYRGKLNGHADSRARGLASYIDTVEPDLSVHQELRHQAIHRARLQPTRYSAQGEPEETRILIYEPMLTEIWDDLTKMGEDPLSWGFSNRTGPHETPVSFVDNPDRRETRSSPGDALLDPIMFAVRLVARTSRIIDEFFGLIRFESDNRVPDHLSRALGGRETEWPFRQQDRSVLLLTSPLSGLV